MGRRTVSSPADRRIALGNNLPEPVGMIRRQSRRCFLGLGILGWVSGCSTPSAGSPVDILLAGLLPSESSGAGELALRFVIRLENASPEAVAVEGGAYKVYLNDTYVGQGLSNESVSIPRLSSTTVTVPVHVSTVRLVGSLYQVLKSNQAVYRLEGTLYVRQGGRQRSYRVVREGAVDLGKSGGSV